MNNFEKQLEKWNNGILRGAQAKLAKHLHVTTATVALWATGKRRPSKGYIAKMAELFFLDEASVTRLFMPTPIATPTYTNFYTPSIKAVGLRESQTALTPVRLQPGVSLPVFSQMPLAYPHFTAQEARAWWTIPQREVQNAQFLFLLPARHDPARLLFIEPCHSWKKGKIMLARAGHKYQLVHIKQTGRALIMEALEGGNLALAELTPVGIVTRQIGNFQVTP